MPITNPAYFCRVCEKPHLYEELVDNDPQGDERGICANCLLKQWRILKKLALGWKTRYYNLKAKNQEYGKKKNQSRRR